MSCSASSLKADIFSFGFMSAKIGKASWLWPYQKNLYLHVGYLNVCTYICGVDIGKAIKQSNFDSQLEKVVVNILYTGSWISYKEFHILKKYDLSMQQFNVLRILRGQHPKTATVNMLIDRMIDKSSNASRIVEKLRKKKFVSRKPCSKDRRRVDIVITDAGLEVLAEATSEIRRLPIMTESLTTEEAKQLNFLLDKFRNPQIKNTI